MANNGDQACKSRDSISTTSDQPQAQTSSTTQDPKLDANKQSTALRWNQVQLRYIMKAVDIKIPHTNLALISIVQPDMFARHNMNMEQPVSVLLLDIDLLKLTMQQVTTKRCRHIPQFDIKRWRIVWYDKHHHPTEIDFPFELTSAFAEWTKEVNGRLQSDLLQFELHLRPMLEDDVVPPPREDSVNGRKSSPSLDTTKTAIDDEPAGIFRPSKRPRCDNKPVEVQTSPPNTPVSTKAHDQSTSKAVSKPTSSQPRSAHTEDKREPLITSTGDDASRHDSVQGDFVQGDPGHTDLAKIPLLSGPLTPEQFDKYISLGSGSKESDNVDILLSATNEEVYEATMNTRIAEQICEEGARNLREFNMLEYQGLHALSEHDRLPAPGTSRYCTPGQAYTLQWAKQNETKVGGGVISHQMGFGKTHTTYMLTVFMRAYINKMWEDCWEDERRAAEDKDWVRHHLPMPPDDSESDVSSSADETALAPGNKSKTSDRRCPSRASWQYECPCELRNTYENHKFKDGFTLIIPLARTMTDPWINEFRSLTTANSTKSTYRNRGFGVADGFLIDDNMPFRLIAAHGSSTDASGNTDIRARASDRDFLDLEEDEDGELTPKRYTDRIVVLTSAESFGKTAWMALAPYRNITTLYKGKRVVKSQVCDDRLIPATIAIDEAHEYKSDKSRAPAAVNKLLIATNKLMRAGHTIEVPSIFLVTGTPWARNVYEEFANVWIDKWVFAAALRGHDWEKDPKLCEFTKAKMSKHAALARRLFSEAVTREELLELGKIHKKNTVHIVQTFQIKFDEQTRFWANKVINLPTLEKRQIPCDMTNDHKKWVNEPLESSLVEVRKRVQQLHQEWINKGKRGSPPSDVQQYFKTAHGLPLTKTAVNFPWITTMVVRYKDLRQADNELKNPFIDKNQDQRYLDLAPAARLGFDSLKLTSLEIGEKQWYLRSNIKESPYYKYRHELWKNSHKSKAIEDWVQLVKAKRSDICVEEDENGKQVGRQCKGIIMTDSPASAIILFSYIEFELLKNKGLCALVTSNMSIPERNLIYEWHQGRLAASKTPADLTEPVFLIATQGIFGTGQNMARANYMLLVEPSPSATKELQTPARCQRKGSLESIYITTLFGTHCKYERILKAKNEKSLHQLADIVACKVEDLDKLSGAKQDGLDTETVADVLIDTVWVD